jgi:hypothetical protein
MNNASNYSYPFTFTINSANTFEYKTITITGATAGTWLTNNSIGLRVWFSLGTGSTYLGTSGSWAATGYYGATGQTNLIATTGATFYITGVQLEVGTVATSFDYRSYGTELGLCQRYFFRMQNDGSSTNFYSLSAEGATAGAGNGGSFPVTLRAIPTVTLGAGVRVYFPSSSVQTPTINSNRCGTTTAALSVTWTGTAATLGQAGSLYNNVANGYIDHSSEL